MPFPPFGILTADNIADEINAAVEAAVLAQLAVLLPAGSVIATGRSTAPTGWLLCQGQAINRTDFADLFAAIGTAYGPGDGSTTFNVPNLQQRFPMGKAASGTGAALGATGGAIDHVHGLDTATSHARLGTFAGSPASIGQTQKTVASYNRTRQITATAMSSVADASAQTSATALGGDTDTANPPFQTVNFLVKT